MPIGWTANFLDPDYYLRSDDMQVIQDAIGERVAAWNYHYGRDIWATELSAYPQAYPGGLINPALPDRANLQYYYWWSLMQEWIAQMLGAGNNVTNVQAFELIPFVVRQGLAIPGQASTYLYDAGLGPLVYDSVGAARVDAGLTDYSAKPGNNPFYSFRVRKPREIDALAQAADNDANVSADGQRAWHTLSGKLYQYGGGGWQHCGQGGREMPDTLDSELAPPFYVAPRQHLPGDYVGGYLLDEMRALCKVTKRFVRQMDPSGGVSKSGVYDASAPNNVWATVKSDMEASWTAAAVLAGGQPLFLASSNGNPGPNYVASMTSGAAQYGAFVRKPFARNVNLYLAVGPDPAIPSAVYDNQGTGYPQGQYVLYAALGNVPPENYLSGYVLSNPPAMPAWPLGGAAPPLDGVTYYASMTAWAMIVEADYTPGFVYT